MLHTVTSEGSQRALCFIAVFILMTLTCGAAGCCCHRHHHHHHDSSAASSEEDFVGSEDARIQRCVRTVSPNLLVDGDYINVAKVDSCAAKGMDAIAGGATSPADAADLIANCVDGETFPEPLLPFVSDFKDCVHRVLT